MVLTTRFYEFLGLTRHSIALFWVKWAGFACLAVTLGLDLQGDYGFPSWLVKLVQLTAALTMGSAAQHRTSDLPTR
jgi:hypothetical protein